MCLAIPVRITKIEGSIGTVEMSGNETTADLSLIENAAVGDYILVHAGMAIQRLDEDEALKTLEIFKELAEKMAEPL